MDLDDNSYFEINEQASAISEFAAKALMAADQLGIRDQIVTDFPLNELETATRRKIRRLQDPATRQVGIEAGAILHCGGSQHFDVLGGGDYGRETGRPFKFTSYLQEAVGLCAEKMKSKKKLSAE